MRVYLIRHAQSENNVLTDETLHMRKVDPSLTELGFEQAQYLADYLETTTDLGVDAPHFGITHFYCSAMFRALLTSLPVTKAIGMKPRVWVNLHEKGGMFLREGKQVNGFSGMTRGAILKDFPNYDLPDDVTDYGWYDHTTGMETETRGMFRAIEVANSLRERSNSDDVLALVSHAGFLDILMKAIFDQLPSEPYTMRYYHYNTAITRIDYLNHRPILHYHNRVDHLPHDKRSA